MTSHLRRAARGFTLIEILIVVVILGILAAVIIPQFTNAADDASVSSARTQLQTMRSQVELYRSQVGSYPAASGAGVDWAPLIAANYIRSAPTWPNFFTEAYTAGTGDLSLTLAAGASYDIDGDGDSDAADTTAVEAW
ncbi:MAG: prepilin-type N-terminal cleavage/methylation domain-containing protein [Phycisphaerae bacterium]|nr:prepilin-type N-terminal cleavage/methylation domain-containing protein [Phycisphaerae bacterium]MBT5657869.1 prepilin-type N-terminal cleavage/methylation domain-containing protein [Phycisphaerae bacterium]MBT7351412.1 prepilin-type N-terminal cleavage/methylation domain-containing protein [Phycisphaerae bacterium]